MEILWRFENRASLYSNMIILIYFGRKLKEYAAIMGGRGGKILYH
jgi:hypothetical protein